ncbi:hypothetical protein F503_07468 [Ophiostoma piceae UAMH 11346]|uniref:DUF6590 domain-containing protein n=1 Tax=Ophiostoma piceae (strain UAMH 11346) TaxID=1262450 RepID=S3CA43_OPHP1|nr:hypothetical protein F503_07468 [Ophiostoma piceae UAMH 11346]
MTVQHSSFFTPGRVMLIDWSEPMGHKIGTTINTETKNTHQKNKRFIIVSTSKGHSGCVSISTYGGRGCTKPGSHNEVHGIVYSEGRGPELLPGEAGLGFDPVCMIPDNATEQLQVASRIDYSKVYPVSHNFAVYFIGRISDSDFVKVREAVDVIRQEDYTTTGQFQYM